MASITVLTAPVIPSGTATVYARSNWPATVDPSGTPIGSSTTSASVSAAGYATFSGLTEHTEYVTYQSSPDRYIKFRVDSAMGETDDPVVVSGAVTQSGTWSNIVSLETGTIYNGTTALTPKFAFANVAASQTDSAIVAAVTSKKIRVLAMYAVAGGTATSLTFNSKPGGAGTAKSAAFANGANGGEILPFSPVGWFETASGEGLSVTTGAGSTTGIGVVYIEV